MSLWNDPDLLGLFLNSTPLIDVRAPVEFSLGPIPGSINMPIMNDEERAQVGTCYKHSGQQEAIKLGHHLVSGKIKDERVNAWKQYIQSHPGCRVFCFRGGLRSQIACQWLTEVGVPQVPIPGGQKRLRNFLLSWLNDAPLPKIYRLGGLTGSGKTPFIHSLPYAIDLEGLAQHRGSAFGGHSIQPTQAEFENNLALELIHKKDTPFLLIEDESVSLGKINVPARLYAALRDAPLIVLLANENQRTRNIYFDYVNASNADFFLKGLEKIKKRLSAKELSEITQALLSAFAGDKGHEDHAPWISGLLRSYYDPLYKKDLARNREKIIFEGEGPEVRDFLRSLEKEYSSRVS
jgi:tRNA 2-selenouridine synthase